MIRLMEEIREIAQEMKIPLYTVRVEWNDGKFKHIYVIEEMADTIIIKHDCDYPNGIYHVPSELEYLKKLLPHICFA